MEMDVKEFFVSTKGDRDFTSIAEALDAAKIYDKCDVVIHIAPGVYRERIVINQNNISLIGMDANKTVITYSDGAFDVLDNGEKRGTFRTSSVFIDADYFYAYNITFMNEAGQGDEAGQAIAMYADGDHLVFENCRFDGYQDTLFTAPLPLKEMQPGGFKGPKEFAPRKHGRHLYKKCYIAGNVDFIFGSATAYFQECEIFMKNRSGEVKGYVVAPSTYQDTQYGYVFERCSFTSDCPPESAYLGRPWRNHAKAVILNSKIGGHIKKAGWHDWNKKDAWDIMFFAEYNNSGAGAGDETTRAPFVKFLTDEQAYFYSRENVIGF